MRRPSAWLGLALLSAGLSGCVSIDWRRTQRHQRVEREVLRELRPGRDDLASCLDRLGAPLFVFEEPEGVALAWGWYESDTWGLGVSIPVAKSASASVDVLDEDSRLKGVVLFFDRDWVLRFARRGKLAEVARRAPSLTAP